MTRKRRQYGTGSLYPRSDGKWVGTIEAGWTTTGARRRITVTANNEVDCKRKLRDRQLQIDRDGPAGPSTRATVKTWAATWLDTQQASLRPKTWADYRSAVTKWIVPAIGHRRLAELTPGDIRAVASAQRKAGRSSTTTLRTQVVLTAMLKAALVEGHPVPPRVLAVKRPVKAVHDRTALTVTEAIRVLDVAAIRSHEAGMCSDCPPPHEADALSIQSTTHTSRWVAALLQGMRQGECLGLTWHAIDLDRNLIDVSWQLQTLPYLDRKAKTFRVPDGYEHRHLEGAWHLVRPKTQRGQRIIPVVPPMAYALSEWRKYAPTSRHDLVWPRPDGKPQSSKADSVEWRRLQLEVDVHHPSGRPYHLHEARNTTATLLLEAGVDPEVIKAILGHSSIVTSRGYMQVNDALARRALEGVAERLQLR